MCCFSVQNYSELESLQLIFYFDWFYIYRLFIEKKTELAFEVKISKSDMLDKNVFQERKKIVSKFYSLFLPQILSHMPITWFGVLSNAQPICYEDNFQLSEHNQFIYSLVIFWLKTN